MDARVEHTIEDIARMQHEIAALVISMRDIDTGAQKECAPILKKAAKKTAPLRRKALVLGRAIDGFVRAHRAELTNRGKKVTVPVQGGAPLKWRKSKPAVQIKDEEAVLNELLRMGKGYEDFIRRTPSINKVKLAEHPIKAARISGVHVEPNRKFIIELPGVKDRMERKTTSKKLEIVRPKSRT